MSELSQDEFDSMLKGFNKSTGVEKTYTEQQVQEFLAERDTEHKAELDLLLKQQIDKDASSAYNYLVECEIQEKPVSRIGIMEHILSARIESKTEG